MVKSNSLIQLWRLYYSNSCIYEGTIFNDKREGYGTLKYPETFIYVGQFKNDNFDGKGLYTDLKNGDTYEG